MLYTYRTSELYNIAKKGTWGGKKVENEIRWEAAWSLYVRLSSFSGFGEEYVDPTNDRAHDPDWCDDCDEVIKELNANSEAEVRMHAIYWLTQAAFAGNENARQSLSNKAEWGLCSQKNIDALNSKINDLVIKQSVIESSVKSLSVILSIMFIICMFLLIAYLKHS